VQGDEPCRNRQAHPVLFTAGRYGFIDEAAAFGALMEGSPDGIE
jgi:hypothetical protein